MTRNDLVRELAALESALRDRVIVVRVIIEPIYGTDRYAPAIAWRKAGRIVRSFRVGATYPKEETAP